MISTSLDDFEIEKTLGKGTFGSVYLVKRKKDNRIYAIKSVVLEKLSKKQQADESNVKTADSRLCGRQRSHADGVVQASCRRAEAAGPAPQRQGAAAPHRPIHGRHLRHRRVILF